MDYTYVKDESGKITDILVNGKPVKRGSMRGFRKAQEKAYFKLYDRDCEVTNPFSGAIVLLNGLEATIYSFCVRWMLRYEQGGENVIQVYDDMKYFMLEINPNAYRDLID
jgi:hypothetical protein